MKSIRIGVFETNSSSTHSLTMCSQQDYNNWESGKVYLNEGSGWASFSENKNKKFVTKEEAIEILTNSKYPPTTDLNSLNDEELDEYFKEQEIYSCGSYFEDEYLEGFDEKYTTPSGEVVVAFGKFGYCG